MGSLMFAQETSIGVRPLKQSIVLAPGESVNIEMSVINTQPSPRTVKSEVQTYVAHDESGYPTAQQIAADDPRNIESWVKIVGDNPFTVGPNEEKTVQFTITAPDDAPPGGYYGAVTFSPAGSPSETEGVKVIPEVASLLLIEVSGEKIIKGQVESFALKNGGIYSDQGVQIKTEFENGGNTHLAPDIQISLYDKNGKQLEDIFRARGKNGEETSFDEIDGNPNRNHTLPGSKRTYVSEWKDNVEEGEYEARLTVVLEDGQKLPTEKLNFSFEVDDDVVITDITLHNDKERGHAVARVTLSNEGTGHQKLEGKISIYNPFKLKVAEIAMKEEDLPYLEPKSEITHEFSLGALLGPGKYIVVSEVAYGITPSIIDFKKTININEGIQLWHILVVLMVVIGLVYMFVLPRLRENK